MIAKKILFFVFCGLLEVGQAYFFLLRGITCSDWIHVIRKPGPRGNGL